jgi:hypothetical protein
MLQGSSVSHVLCLIIANLVLEILESKLILRWHSIVFYIKDISITINNRDIKKALKNNIEIFELLKVLAI